MQGQAASEIIKRVAEDFTLPCGTLADTGYAIPRYRAADETLFDLMQNVLDITTENRGKIFVLYDDYGKLTVTDMEEMLVPILIDEETAENYDFTSSIDRDTFNRVKLFYDNKATGKREVYISQDSKTIAEWGLLQRTESVNPKAAVNPSVRADAMLSRSNRVRRTLSIRNAFGDDRVRGGSSLYVRLTVDGKEIEMRMLVESVRHRYGNGEHFMDLSLRGGMFE